MYGKTDIDDNINELMNPIRYDAIFVNERVRQRGEGSTVGIFSCYIIYLKIEK